MGGVIGWDGNRATGRQGGGKRNLHHHEGGGWYCGCCELGVDSSFRNMSREMVEKNVGTIGIFVKCLKYAPGKVSNGVIIIFRKGKNEELTLSLLEATIVALDKMLCIECNLSLEA